ncbi:rho GTPase-activating protein REN1 isoform X9 [Zea mays]|uniref:rho GTPase-activating protein REN1 isoform X9 n=1 Tax=Zea mays TaxID=4577 RepID=UPI000C6C6352|nr:rho GTPase-activating protein REN1 isoform X9 [Zea mays]|eukprot:XP_023156108.1 rho GTPase-activating protein REN1 isoform X8 [Zea mays]
MSASEFRIPYQQVSPSQPAENVNQFKTCRCGEGDPNSTSETGDSPPASCPNCQVLKSGHLLLSSKGIGWTSWKKRWFVLTRASLVFFRSDPNVPPPRGAEPIVTLGGIDLNNSGSVVIKEERKLLTVFFPDGHGERTFTLKAETTGDLNEWRNALESAIAQAPSIANTMGQNPIFSTDVEAESAESPAEHCKLFVCGAAEDRSVIGRPAKFALVDADGSPSFLEKALKFIEDHGIKVEGILRQSADVEEVKRRIRDYEKGKNEFSPEEDAHVIGDCIKYVLREMPSSPVPASCCTALVKAYRSDKARRLDEINRVINEVFPEPNRQLLQRTRKKVPVLQMLIRSLRMMLTRNIPQIMTPMMTMVLMILVKMTLKKIWTTLMTVNMTVRSTLISRMARLKTISQKLQVVIIISIFNPPIRATRVENGASREKTMEKSCSSAHKGKRTLWGRTSARKDLSTEEIECCSDDEALVEKLESNKIDLQSKIAKEAKENAILWSSLEKRKEELHERRLALEKEVENLRDQLKRVMNLRRGQVSSPSTIDSKVRGQQLCCESCNQRLLNTDRLSGPESSSVEASPTVGSDPAFDMGDIEQSRKQAAQHSPSSRDKPSHEAVGGITQRAPQRGHSIAREGQDGSSSLSSSNSKWNLAQKQYSNSPLIRGLHVSSRLEDFGGSISPAASSALAKLTNRLNFLKERRALLASEMQSLDLGRPPTVKSPTPKGHESKNS